MTPPKYWDTRIFRLQISRALMAVHWPMPCSMVTLLFDGTVSQILVSPPALITAIHRVSAVVQILVLLT